MAYGTIQLVEKTTIYLDAELRRRLRLAARAHGVPQAELIRMALAEYLDEEEAPPLPSWVGFASVGGDAGEDKRRYREQWRRELAERYPRA
jgi:hypothetical protein